MKKTYNKLSSELLLVETEGAFMGSSVLLESQITVQEYKDGFAGLEEGSFTMIDGYKSFDVTFE